MNEQEGRKVLDEVMIAIQRYLETHGENPEFHIVNAREYSLLEEQDLTRGPRGELQVWGVTLVPVTVQQIEEISEVLELPE